MLFFGWGGRNISRQISPTQAVVLTYRYFHLMFLFRVAFANRFQLATWTDQGWASRPITEPEATALLGGEVLRPPLWQRFGLLIALGLLAVVLVTVAVVSSIAGA